MIATAVLLEDRGLVAVDGADARPFLQGLVSNDVRRATPERAVWAALLTPQGKYLHDFFVIEHDGALLLDCEAARRADLIRRLSMFKLRSKVAVTDRSDTLAVVALFGGDTFARAGLAADAGAAAAFGGGVAFVEAEDWSPELWRDALGTTLARFKIPVAFYPWPDEAGAGAPAPSESGPALKPG